jgi:uncharacterized membrane protein (DUF2068 family)
MGRRVEHRGWVIWYLIFERGLKGLLLVGTAVYLYTHAETGLDPLVARLTSVLNLTAGTGFLHKIVVENLAKLAGISEGALWILATGTLIYGVIESAESVGLILRRRWAEYLVVLATALFIPLEVREVLMRPGVIRVATLAINVAVVIYLVRKKRLFQLDAAGEA